MTLTKQSLIIIVVIIACAAMQTAFPVEGIFQNVVVTLAFLVVMPWLCARFILQKKADIFGVRMGDWRIGAVWSLLSLAAALVLFFLAIRFTTLGDTYAVPRMVQDNFWLFVAYVSLVGIHIAALEFFLAGVITNGLRTELGIAVIALQFMVMLFLLGWDSFTAVLSLVTPFAALTAYYSRSVYYAIGVSILFVLIVDTVIVAMNHM